MFARLRSFVRAIADRRRFEAGMDDELKFHIEARANDLARGGMSRTDALRHARLELGGVEGVKDECRQSRGLRVLDELRQDLHYALRVVRRTPIVSTCAIASLALGIGANTATFSLYEQLLHRRLPVVSPDALVNITANGPRAGARETNSAGGIEAIFSVPLFRDLENLDDFGLTGVAAFGTFPASVAYNGEATMATGLLVSGGYFDTIGVTPARGRLIAPADDRTGGLVVVVTYAFWNSRLAADPGAIGQPLVVNGHPLTIIGVAAPDFAGTAKGLRPDVFVPLSSTAAMRGDARDSRLVHWLYLTGRLRPGVPMAVAEERLNGPFAAITRDIEAPELRTSMGDDARLALLDRRIRLEDGSRGRNSARGEMATAMMLLVAVTGCVLLIAAANVANLLLARAADRSAEVALRLAVGASSGRLVRWLLTEAALIGVLGGIAAVFALEIAVRLLAGTAVMDGAVRLELAPATYVFALTLGSLTGLGLGLVPARHGVRAAMGAGLLRHGTRTSSSRTTSRYRTVLATTQIALATALLAQAGLFITSLSRVAEIDLGLRETGLVMFGVSPGLNGYSRDAARALTARLEEQLTTVPGVQSISTTTIALLMGSDWGQNLTVDGFAAGDQADTRSSRASVGPGYFRTLDIPLIAGREFTSADVQGAPKVAVVNEAFARKFQLGDNVIGTRMALGAGSSLPLDIEIVGLVADAAYSNIRDVPPPQFFLPRAQDDGGGPVVWFYVRTDADDASVISAIRPLVAQLDPNLPVTNLRTVDEQVRLRTTSERYLAVLSAVIAGLATLLAGIGLYAVLAQVVATRWRELGIRMALGATTGDIRRSIGARIGRIAVVGVVLGSIGAVALGRLGQSFIFGVDGLQPAVIGGAIGIALLVAALAAALPARRAGTVNPADVLRAD